VYLNGYEQSVRQGVDNLKSHLRAESQSCPAEQFLLAGYSQGAQVARTAFDEIGPELQGRVRSMIVFGDPTYKPANVGETVGRPTVGTNSGIFATVTGTPGTVHTVDVRHRMRSYCDAHDIVCQSPGIGHAAKPHFSYGDWATRQAADFLVGIEPPAACPVSVASWSASGAVTTSNGVAITNVDWLEAKASPGYRFVGFVGVAEQAFNEGPVGQSVVRVARTDQPSYAFPKFSLDSPEQNLSTSNGGRAYYLLARAVPEKCGARTTVSFAVPVAQHSHIVIKGSLTSGRAGVAGATLLWYHSRFSSPTGPLDADGDGRAHLTASNGSWTADYKGPVKEVLPAGVYRMRLAFAGDVNLLPSISPLIDVRVH
jgi:hypothetical protein